ncbi:MAG: M20/M25/M40 family metallo-hydrolase, partial [Gemmatimonadetes bacterium]|nr:M20/M25/M40 family metallo-hydrolase [Gemmatimonadota bacterium]
AKTARKGLSTYRLEVQGRAAHSGIDPERGVSAIAELAEQIRRVLALADPLRGTTLNVGAMAGGVAVNVVAPEAWAEIEARYGSAGEGRRVDTALRTLEPVLPGASLSLERGQNRPPLERTAGVVRLYQHARRLAAELGFVLGEGSTGGASDGCLTAALGVPTLDGLGVQGDGAHTPDEYILIDDLPRRVALLARLFETL